MSAGTPDMATVEPEILSAVLDRLLPGYEDLPPAGQMKLGDVVIDDASDSPALAVALANVVQSLPDGFRELDGEAQDQALGAIEATDPDTFAGLINLAYTAYYTDARVLQFISRRSGYLPGPPQPRGYQVAPFDERVMEQIRKRDPFWRKVDSK